MRSRAEVIYQAALVVPPWLGINPGSAKPVDQIAGGNRIRTIGPAAAELQPTRGLLSRRLALRDHNQPPGRRDTEARFEREIEALAAMRGIVVAHGPRQRSEIEREIEARSANVYAGFFLRQLQPDMLVLDCGCGTATITIGLAEALPAGTVIGIDLAKDSLAAARRYASVMGRQNLFCAAADLRRLPFPEAAFDAVLCHSVLETVGDLANLVAEIRRVTKFGGVVGAASVEYGGLILAGKETAGPTRFYEIRQLLWRAAGIAEPNMGRRLRGLFEAGGFTRVEAVADYVSYGTPDRVASFARDRAAECRDHELHEAVARHGIASAEELIDLASQWEAWGRDPQAFFAFPWCRVLATR
jgi:SAM-dependent methyltransferase